MNQHNVNANTRISILSSIKKNILDSQDQRRELMIEFLAIKRKVMTLDHRIGKLQRDLLENIP